MPAIDITIQGNYDVGKQSDPSGIDNSSISIDKQLSDDIRIEMQEYAGNNSSWIELTPNPESSFIVTNPAGDINGSYGDFLFNIGGVDVEGFNPNGTHHKLRFTLLMNGVNGCGVLWSQTIAAEPYQQNIPTISPNFIVQLPDANITAPSSITMEELTSVDDSFLVTSYQDGFGTDDVENVDGDGEWKVTYTSGTSDIGFGAGFGLTSEETIGNTHQFTFSAPDITLNSTNQLQRRIRHRAKIESTNECAPGLQNWTHANNTWSSVLVTYTNNEHIPNINACTNKEAYNYICLNTQGYSDDGICETGGAPCVINGDPCDNGSSCIAMYCDSTCDCPFEDCVDGTCLATGESCTTECQGNEYTSYVTGNSNLCNFAPGAQFTLTSVDDGDLQITVTQNPTYFNYDVGGEQIIAKLWDFDYNGGLPTYDTTHSWFLHYNSTIEFGEDCPGNVPVCGPNINTNPMSINYTYSTAGTYDIYFQTFDASGFTSNNTSGEFSLNQRGCTDPESDDYNSQANQEDGSCTYSGCPYSEALDTHYFCEIGTNVNSYPCQNNGGDTIISGVDSNGSPVDHVYNIGNVDDDGTCSFPELSSDNQSWLEGYITNSAGTYWTDPTNSNQPHVDLDDFITTEYPNTTAGNENIKTYFNNLEDRILLYGCNSTYIDPDSGNNAPTGYDLSASWSEVWCESEYTLMNTGDCTTTYACNTTNDLNMTTPLCYDDDVHNLCENNNNCCTDSCCDGSSNDCVGSQSDWESSQYATGLMTDCSTSCNCVGGDNDDNVTCTSTTDSHCTGANYYKLNYLNCSGQGAGSLIDSDGDGTGDLGTFESWCNMGDANNSFYQLTESNCTGESSFVTWANSFTNTDNPKGLWGVCDNGSGGNSANDGLDCYSGYASCQEFCLSNGYLAEEYGCTNINYCNYSSTANVNCTDPINQDNCTPCGTEKTWWYPDQDGDGVAFGQGIFGCVEDFPTGTYIQACGNDVAENFLNGDPETHYCIADSEPQCNGALDVCGVCNGGITLGTGGGQCDLSNHNTTDCGVQNQNDSWVDECGICFGSNYSCNQGGCLCSGCMNSGAINYDPEATVDIVGICENGGDATDGMECYPYNQDDATCTGDCNGYTGACVYLGEGGSGVCTCDTVDLGSCCTSDESALQGWCEGISYYEINLTNCAGDASFPSWCNDPNGDGDMSDGYHSITYTNCTNENYIDDNDLNCDATNNYSACGSFQGWCNNKDYYTLNYTNCTTIPDTAIDFTPYCTDNNYMEESSCNGLCNGGTCEGFHNDFMYEEDCNGLCTFVPGYCTGDASCQALGDDEGSCTSNENCTWIDELSLCSGNPPGDYMLNFQCGSTSADTSGSQWCSYNHINGQVTCQACPPNPNTNTGNCYANNCVWSNFPTVSQLVILNDNCAFPTHFSENEQTNALNDYCAFPTHFSSNEQTNILNDNCAFPTHFDATEQSTALNTYCAFPTHFSDEEQLTALNTYCAFPTHFDATEQSTALNTYCAFPTHFDATEQSTALNTYCAFPTHFDDDEKTTALNTYCTLDHVIAEPASNGCIAGDQCHTLSTDCPTWNTSNGYMLTTDCFAVNDTDCTGYCDDTVCPGIAPNDFIFLDTFYAGDDTNCIDNTATDNTDFNLDDSICYSNLEDYLNGKGWNSLNSNIGGLFDTYCDDAGYWTLNETNCTPGGGNQSPSNSTFQTWCNNENYWTLNETNCTPGGGNQSPSEAEFKTWANNDGYYKLSYENCSNDSLNLDGDTSGDLGTFESWCNVSSYWTLNETNCTPGGVVDSPSEADFKTWANNDGYYQINETNCTTHDGDGNFETWCNNANHWLLTEDNCTPGTEIHRPSIATFKTWANNDGYYQINSTNCATGNFYSINETNCTTYDNDNFETWCNNADHWLLNETNCTPGTENHRPSVETFKTWANNDGYYQINSTNCATGNYYSITYSNCTDENKIGDNDNGGTFEAWCNSKDYYTINASNCSDNDLSANYYELNQTNCTPGNSAGYCSDSQYETFEDCPEGQWTSLNPTDEEFISWCSGYSPSLVEINETNCNANDGFGSWCNNDYYYTINETNCKNTTIYEGTCSNNSAIKCFVDADCDGGTCDKPTFESWANADGYYDSTFYPDEDDSQWLSGFDDTYYIGWCNTDIGAPYCQSWCQDQPFSVGEAGYPSVPSEYVYELISYPMIDEFNIDENGNMISGERFIRIVENSFRDDDGNLIDIPMNTSITLIYKSGINMATVTKSQWADFTPNDKIFDDENWVAPNAGFGIDPFNFMGEHLGLDDGEKSIRGFLVAILSPGGLPFDGNINWQLPS